MLKTKSTTLPALLLGVLLAAIACGPARAAVKADAHSAVVFVYQRVGEDSLPSGNLALDRFAAHIEELKAGGYNVVSLDTLAASLEPDGTTLPPKSVAITFDGAYAATLNAVTPLLDAAGFPYAIFFTSDQADAGGSYMTWDDLGKLRKKKRVTLGILPSAYAHMTDNSASVNAEQMNRAVSKYRDAFGEAPTYFSWPYGEYSASLRKQVEAYGFKAAFGRQSGVAHPESDQLALPRFTMTRGYGDIDRFRLTASALPLPVNGVTPGDMIVGTQNPPVIGFTVTQDIKDLSRLSCFASGEGRLTLERPGGNRVEIRLQQTLQDRRTRINCTMPEAGPDGDLWRWFGMMLLVPGYSYDDPSLPADEDAADE